MQATHLVEVIPYAGTGSDGYGNDVTTWGTPRPEWVFGWAPGGSSEQTVRQQQLTIDLELYAPPSFTCDPRDRLVVGGVEYAVEGGIDDFNHGPFNYRPGVRVNLRRVTG